MVSTEKEVPFHMRDDSDVEDAEADAIKVSEQGGGGGAAGTGSGGGWKRSEVEKNVAEIAEGINQIKGLFGKGKAAKGTGEREGVKPRLGNIEVDPEIDWSKSGPTLTSRAKMEADGMINIWVDLKKALPDLPKDYARPVKEWAVDPEGAKDCPPLNIVIFIVGSRGDVQPYLSLALHLIKSHGHRIRIATHPDFKDFVLSANKRLKGKQARGMDLEGRLEYFDVGGDPKELMAYMVKNPGLLPAWETIKSGEIGKKRRMTEELLQGFYRSAFEPDGPTGKAFAADAIISNPPAFAHVHVAEALGLPLLMSFTMPWTSTTAFKHPLVNIASTNAQQGLTNYFSFGMAEMLQWQGLGDVINHFRTATLGIEPLISRHGAGAVERLKVPWTYCWSEGLIEKPEDWKEHIDISGFYFYEADSDFKPDDDLAAFLADGEAPIYVGFGSVVVEDATAMTQTIFDAVEKAGTRALVSAGWGGLGGADIPKSVFILKGNIPHDWLFADGRVSAVCHHGGAGTTAIGLRNGLPTIVVPFFGDQKFWGDMIHRAKAGPAPIPQKKLTPDVLAEAIKYALSPEARTAAGKMGEQIRKESGEEKGVESFHRHLPLKNMRCEVDPTRVAVWYSETLYLRLSAEAAGVLASERKLEMKNLKPLRAREYATRSPARDPISGGSLAVMHLVQNHYTSVAQIFYDPPKGALNTMFSVPQGILDLVIAMYEGFDSLPKMMGSEIRQKGPVDDFSSGVREGGKGLFWGWWDGITGLVTEPVAGGKKEGALGVVKGMGRSYVNVTARPAAGILGVMALPISGAWKSIRRSVGGAPTKELAGARRGTSEEAGSRVSPEERNRILDRFGELERGTQERKEGLKRKAKLFMTGDEKAFEEEMGVMPEESGSESKSEVETGGSTSSPIAVGQKAETTSSSVGAGGGEDTIKPNSESLRGEIIEGVKAQISAQPEKGDALEEAEKRGYERAMEEIRRQQAAQAAGGAGNGAGSGAGSGAGLGKG